MTILEQHPLTATGPAAAATTPDSTRLRPVEIEWRRASGVLLVIAGLVGVCIGWFGVSGTDAVWKQIPFLVSGGIGGSVLIGLGVTLVLTFEHARDRQQVEALLVRLENLEYGLAGEFDGVARQFDALRDDLAAGKLNGR
jgi:hypothetical protein